MSAATAPSTFLDQDFYVPTFKIVVVGEPVGSEVIHDITTVTYKDSIDQIDSFEITISNWDDGDSTYRSVLQRKFKYSDQHLFDPGKKIELWMGYYGNNDGN